MQARPTPRREPREARTDVHLHPAPPGPPERKGLIDSLGYYYRFFTDPIGTVRARFERYGDLYYAPSNGVGLYVLRHPDHLYEVLVERAADYGKTHTAFDQLTKFLGFGLLTTDGETWRRQRRMVNPAFAHKRLAGYAAAMSDEARREVARWRPGEVRDMSRDMMELTLRVVCRTLFNHDVRGQTDAVAEAMNGFRDHLGRPNFFPSWLPAPGQRAADRALEAIDDVILGMIADRRAGRTASPEPPDLLHMLLTAVDEEGDGGKLGDREIRDQLVTLFLAGHETTSHALTWTLYLLSQNRGAEARVRAEIGEVLGDRAPGYDDLERLPYTRWCFEEAMRLYPPAYTLARRAERETQIGGYTVPKGSEVILWLYMTHHDARWFPDPEAFRPERFSPEEVAARPKLAYLPFGAGARACIGKVFAQIEGQLLLATLLQHHRFTLAPGFEPKIHPRVTLSPKNGMHMRIDRAR
jgi:cytochrome P450